MDQEPAQRPHVLEYSTPPALRQSGLGIASCIFALLGAAAIAAGLIVLRIPTPMQRGPHGEDDFSGFFYVIVFAYLLLASKGLCIVGGLLGIIGLVQRHRRKAFAIAGPVLSLVIGLAPHTRWLRWWLLR